MTDLHKAERLEVSLDQFPHAEDASPHYGVVILDFSHLILYFLSYDWFQILTTTYEDVLLRIH